MLTENQSQIAKTFVSQVLGAVRHPDKRKGRKTVSELFSEIPDFGGSSEGETGSLIYEIKKLVEKNARNRYAIASAFYRVGRLDAAEYLLFPMPQFCSPSQLNIHASVASGQGKTHDAEVFWNRALGMDPEFLPAIKGLLALHEKANNEKAASAMAEKLAAAQASAQPSASDLTALVVYKPWRELQRFGGANDGGYLVMDQQGGYDCFLSGGVGKYVKFEEEFCTRFEVECHAFDPTVDNLPSQHGRIHFEKKGIGGADSEATTNLSEYLRRHNDVFVKMDVEGFEYNWIESLSDEEIKSIKQLVMEWHSPNSKRRLACIARLTKTHVLVHVHPNNFRKDFNKVAGVNVPIAFETTFVRREASSTEILPNTQPLPHPLDSPNVAENPEVRLGWWPFVSPSPESEASAPLRDIPSELRARYTLNGAIPVRSKYFNQTKAVPVRLPLTRYEEVLDALAKGTFEYYGATLGFLLEATSDFSLKDMDVCVFGCVDVNCDGIALHSHASSVKILEYNVPVTEHPKVSCMKLTDALKLNYQFDAAFSISSFEHDGLGRYGDPLDPDGDLRAMQEAYRMLKPGGILFFAVPVGPDCLVWNAHRIYGPKRLPMILKSWTVLKSYGFSEALYARPVGTYKQPVFVLKKEA